MIIRSMRSTTSRFSDSVWAMTASMVRPAEIEEAVNFLDGTRFPRGPIARKCVRPEANDRPQRRPDAFITGRRHQTLLSAPQREDLPGEIDAVANPDILENVSGIHGRGNADQKFVIGGRILALDERWRAKDGQSSGGPIGSTRRVG